MTKAIVKIDHKEYGLEASKAKEIQSVFLPMLDKMVELESEYNEIVKLPIGFETCEKAKAVRLKYVKVRTETKAIHKKAKEFYLKGGRFVDGWKNAQLFASEGIEETLLGIEKHFERQEEARKEDLAAERLVLLEPYEEDTEFLDLGEMPENVWDKYFTGVKATKKEEEDNATALAEKERIEKEADEKKVSRMETISAMGMVWVELLEHYEKDGATISKEAVLTLDSDEFEMVVEAASNKIAKAKTEADKISKAKEAEDAKEAVKAAKIAKDLKAKEDAEAAKLAEQKKADLAPDKDKLNTLAVDLVEITLPNVSTAEAQEILDGVEDLLTKVAKYITDKTEEL